jgi:hypothetical protein
MRAYSAMSGGGVAARAQANASVRPCLAQASRGEGATASLDPAKLGGF